MARPDDYCGGVLGSTVCAACPFRQLAEELFDRTMHQLGVTFDARAELSRADRAV